MNHLVLHWQILCDFLRFSKACLDRGLWRTNTLLLVSTFWLDAHLSHTLLLHRFLFSPLISSFSPLSWWPAASSPASPGNAAGTAWSPAGGSQPAWVDQWAWWPRCPPAGPGRAGSPPPAKGQVSVPASCPTRPPPPLWGERERGRERERLGQIKRDNENSRQTFFSTCSGKQSVHTPYSCF